MNVSVAMAVYNGARYLREQLDSIARQRRVPDELVISDNCSTDDTARIVERFASFASFPVRLNMNATNLGVSKNFERAISLCSGNLICLADCDDVWYPNKLRIIEEVFVAAPSIGLVFSDADLVDERLRPTGYRLWRTNNKHRNHTVILEKGRLSLEALFRWQPAWVGHTMAFDVRLRPLLLPMPELPSMRCGNHDVWIALLGACVADIACIYEPLVAHRRHSTQATAGEHQLSALPRLKRATHRFATLVPSELGDLICQRLYSVLDIDAHREYASEIKEWSTHLHVRSNLAGRRLQRLPLIMRELAHRRYHRFSNGVLSALRDIYSGVGEVNN